MLEGHYNNVIAQLWNLYSLNVGVAHNAGDYFHMSKLQNYLVYVVMLC